MSSDPPRKATNQGFTFEGRVPAVDDGEPLAVHLARAYPHSDLTTWRARIEAGELWVEGVRAESATTLRTGQRVTWVKPAWAEPTASLDVPVLYEDDDLVAVHKPAGLPTLPGSGYLDNTLLARVRAHSPTASPVHRLGRGTSGLVLFVKNAVAARGVQAQWQSRRVEKIYRALVSGDPAFEEQRMETPIGGVPDDVVGELFAASPTGKPARSTLRVLERRGASSLVEVAIDTGRPHQISIHTAAAGHPLVGDPLYGDGGGRRPGSTARPGDVGYALHAHTLRLLHPRSGVSLCLEAPPPALLQVAAPPSG